MNNVAGMLSHHQTLVVWGTYILAFICGAIVSFMEKKIPLRKRFQVVLIFLVEFVLLALVLDLINEIMKIRTPKAPRNIGEFIATYGVVFVLLLSEYLIIVMSCGLKFWRIYEGNRDAFQVDPQLYGKHPPDVLDWLLYSAENVVPGRKHAGITPAQCRAAKLFSFGQFAGNFIVTILLLKFIVSLLGLPA